MIQRQRGNMATSAPDALELLTTVGNCGFNLRIIGNDLSWNRQCRLENSCSGYIGAGQFIHQAVAIRIYTNAKPLLGLNTVMMVKGIVGELPQRDDVAGLMERTNDQAWRNASRSRQTRRRDTDHL